MRIVNRTTATIDYRSRRRNEGLRVWKDRCQMISPVRDEWTAVGPQLGLPLEVPSSVQDLVGTDAVRSAAFRYELEQPGSDLFEVLTKQETFEDALHAA